MPFLLRSGIRLLFTSKSLWLQVLSINVLYSLGTVLIQQSLPYQCVVIFEREEGRIGTFFIWR